MPAEQNHLEQYYKYSDALRNWLIVYGAGGIALLYSKDSSVDTAKIGGMTISLLIAVFLQVMVSFINKWNSWLIHTGEANPHIRTYNLYKIMTSHPYVFIWINIMADVMSLIAFFFASGSLLVAFK